MSIPLLTGVSTPIEHGEYWFDINSAGEAGTVAITYAAEGRGPKPLIDSEGNSVTTGSLIDIRDIPGSVLVATIVGDSTVNLTQK